MAQYVVQLQGGGSMTVNASSPQAAADNVTASGNTPAGSSGGGGNGGSGGNGGLTSTTASGQQIYNKDAQATAEANANQQAINAYNSAMLEMTGTHYANMDQQAKDQLAFDKAKQAYSESLSTAGMTGVFNGQPTLAAQAQAAGLSGMYNGAPTEAARQFNTTATQSYLNLLSNLKGANDPFQYLRTLQGTPGGMADIVNAAAGRYQLGGTASGEVAPRATIQGQVDNMNNAQPGGSNSQDPNLQGMPAASQIDSRNYRQMLPSQQSALWSAYQYGGPSGAMNPADAQAMYAQSMPRYGGATQGKVNLFTA